MKKLTKSQAMWILMIFRKYDSKTQAEDNKKTKPTSLFMSLSLTIFILDLNQVLSVIFLSDQAILGDGIL